MAFDITQYRIRLPNRVTCRHRPVRLHVTAHGTNLRHLLPSPNDEKRKPYLYNLKCILQIEVVQWLCVYIDLFIFGHNADIL